MNICLGGTFSPLHKGHRTLLKAAVAHLGPGILYVGLTSDMFASKGRPGERLMAFSERKKALERAICLTGCRQYRIVEISCANGIADSSAYLDAVVVSRETYPQALTLNKARRTKGLRGLSIITVNIVKNGQGAEIRASKIRQGVMDIEGRVR